MNRIYRPLTIWHEMGRLQRHMNRLFDETYPQWTRSAPGFPALNVWADEESVLITAELPGLSSKDIELNIINDTITISGKGVGDDLPDNAQHHRQERTSGEFARSTKLTYSVDTDKVVAKFVNGVLEVVLPRTEAARPKKITVKTK